MNKENLLKVADLIEQHQERFSMTVWGSGLDLKHDCGTCACIAGFASLLGDLSDKNPKYVASIVLDLTNYEAHDLFQVNDDGIWVKYADELGLPVHKLSPLSDHRTVLLGDIKPEMAVTMLRNLASGEWTFPV